MSISSLNYVPAIVRVKFFFNKNSKGISDLIKPPPFLVRAFSKDVESQEIKPEKNIASRILSYLKANPCKVIMTLMGSVAIYAYLFAPPIHFAMGGGSGGIFREESIDELKRDDFPSIQTFAMKAPETAFATFSPTIEEAKSFFVFTSYTTDNAERLGLSRKVAANHRAYCQMHGYDYDVFEKNLADRPGKSALPYWSKIAGFLKLLNDPKLSHKKWFIWLDDDMVITNSKIKLEELSKRIPKPISLLVTEDSMSKHLWHIPLNTGFIMVRNDDQGRALMQKLWDMRFNPIGLHTYATCPNQRCLHEQQALTDLLFAGGWRKIVKIIPQRFLDGIGLNTFARENHWDLNRDMYLDYSADPKESRWKAGDFMAQCTGLATRGKRELYLKIVNLREECIDRLISQSQ